MPEPPDEPKRELPAGERHHRGGLAGAGLGALGIVFGDIGTSPLYALRECFSGGQPTGPSPGDVLGVLSLIFWALVVVISVKYLVYVMRADNDGEGGILALTALLDPWAERGGRALGAAALLGVFGAALLYGDGMITPAISVLSAVEGLKIAAPGLGPFVLPLTVGILIALFAFQRRGTAAIGGVFGPLMLVWFAVLAVLGVAGIARAPGVLAAVWPGHAVRFFAAHGWAGFAVLGAVFLVVTGGEALYADMGHFGRRPIRAAWFAVVLPALLLNYFGQGALLLAEPTAVAQPFYRLAPGWALYPLVALATVATVIASQAVISGAFSLSRQAVQLGVSPRLRIDHTSWREIGQVYVPAVNMLLAVATVGLVLGFGSSGALAGAYGVAVTTTMVITTLLAFFVARRRWRWGLPAALGVTAVLLTVDLAFFGANLLKIGDGGWFPLVVGAALFTLMATWRRGRDLLARRLSAAALPLDELLDRIDEEEPVRVPGSAVFMTGRSTGTPPMLLHHLEQIRVLHQRVVLLNVVTAGRPRARPAERLECEELRLGFARLTVRYGFMESPDVPAALRKAAETGLEIGDPDEVTWYVGRETLIPAGRLGMPVWRERLFVFMARNSARATAFFGLPPRQVVELGIQVEL